MGDIVFDVFKYVSMYQAMDIKVHPLQADINGLYILITETYDKWMPKKVVDNSYACMQYLHEQLEDGTFGQCIGNVFGQWYLYSNMLSFKKFELAEKT